MLNPFAFVDVGGRVALVVCAALLAAVFVLILKGDPPP